VERLAQREHEPLLREHREDAGGRAAVLLADERGRIHGARSGGCGGVVRVGAALQREQQVMSPARGAVVRPQALPPLPLRPAGDSK
jgi:hypothetical protein